MVKLSDCIRITEITDKYEEVGAAVASNKPVKILKAIFESRLDIYAYAECGWNENTYTVGKAEYPDHFNREDEKDKRETKQTTNYKVKPHRSIYKITIPYLPYQLNQPYQDRFLEDIMFKGQTDRPLDPDSASVKNPVTIDNLFILEKDVQTLIDFLNETRPAKLVIANKAWQECFAYGINISDKYFSQMEIAKDWLEKNAKRKNAKGEDAKGEDVKLPQTPLKQLASVICKDRTITKIKKSIQVNHNDNTPDHPLYALELDIANKCWEELFGNDKKPNFNRKGPKQFIEKWLEQKYPDLKKNEIERIILTVNPRPFGAPPTI